MGGNQEPIRNYPLGYGLLNQPDNFDRRQQVVGLGQFLPKHFGAHNNVGPGGYIPRAGYSPYSGLSPQGSQVLRPGMIMATKDNSFLQWSQK